MAITVEAIYESGTLKLEHPLPLKEQQKVRVTVNVESNWVADSYGLVGWTGDVQTLRQLAEDVDFGPEADS